MAQQSLDIPRRRSSKLDPGHPVYELDCWLLGSDPVIGRAIVVPADFTIGDLHEVIQRVMPWENGHLHQFHAANNRVYAAPSPLGDMPTFIDLEQHDEDDHTLRDVFEDLKQRFVYEYDFGDGWEHQVKIVRTHAENPYEHLPYCLAGQNGAPPEDCGGLPGYEMLQIALKDPNHPEHEEMLDWLGLDHPNQFDPAHFDRDAANRSLRQVTDH